MTITCLFLQPFIANNTLTLTSNKYQYNIHLNTLAELN